MFNHSISVIIASSRPNLLRHILECLKNQSFKDFEIIVVCKRINKQFKKITSEFDVRLYEDKGKGLSFARNVGLKHAIGKIVVFLDDDITLNENWIQAVINIFNLGGNIGGVGGRPLKKRANLGFESPLWRLNNRIQGVSNWDLEPNSRKEVNYLSGSNMAFYRDVLITAGGFDEKFYGPCAGEEADMCLRINSMGLKLILDSKLNVQHHSNFIKRVLTYHRKDPLYFFALSDNDTYWRVKNQILKGVSKWILYMFTSILHAMFWMLSTLNLRIFFYYIKGTINGCIRSKNSLQSRKKIEVFDER